ncbi:MAG TPA: hypothetical protein VMN36_19360, partial [Verrucomicrobiales bacterium]|nr:hypothetical protein [Verrucomicrobiales bacterium]
MLEWVLVHRRYPGLVNWERLTVVEFQYLGTGCRCKNGLDTDRGSPIGRQIEEDQMAEYGEWNRKGATLSDVTARKEYGVSEEFIIKGIRSGKLEFREGSMHGNPYLKILRSQLELYIAQEQGPGRLAAVNKESERRKINKEISLLKKRLSALEARKAE